VNLFENGLSTSQRHRFYIPKIAWEYQEACVQATPPTYVIDTNFSAAGATSVLQTNVLLCRSRVPGINSPDNSGFGAFYAEVVVIAHERVNHHTLLRYRANIKQSAPQVHLL
jgi:hypothetical protein